ncbi:hypothetical protein GOBAR_DD30294 [Gossypium barbadense]|nr:hypothetical protein GOBAR_DD30294 [Gossypium barbadense]
MTNSRLCPRCAERHKWVHEGQRRSGNSIADSIRNHIQEIDGLQVPLPVKRMELKSWQPSKPLFVKINFDAAYKKQEEKSCSGIVIRNSEGQVLSSKLVTKENVPSVFVAKALACIQSIQ